PSRNSRSGATNVESYVPWSPSSGKRWTVSRSPGSMRRPARSVTRRRLSCAAGASVVSGPGGSKVTWWQDSETSPTPARLVSPARGPSVAEFVMRPRFRGFSWDTTGCGVGDGRCAPGMMRSALDRAVLDALEEELLEDREEHDDRDQRDHGAGGDHARVRAEVRGQVLHADGEGALRRVGQDHERPQEVVPAADDREDRHDARHAPHARPDDGAQHLPGARAVEHGRLEQLL